MRYKQGDGSCNIFLQGPVKFKSARDFSQCSWHSPKFRLLNIAAAVVEYTVALRALISYSANDLKVEIVTFLSSTIAGVCEQRSLNSAPDDFSFPRVMEAIV